MLFNSYLFIFIFLPFASLSFFILHKVGFLRSARLSLLVFSLIFMALWNIYFLAVIIFSVLFNYTMGWILTNAANARHKKIILVLAICGDISLLGFFKYTNFFLANVSSLFSLNLDSLSLIVPIGISFYSFMQIAWLVDVYRDAGKRYDFISYCFFVTFFPYVISGPIARHREIIPQWEDPNSGILNLANLCRGIFIFAIGLFKKTVFADTLAIIADGGFNASSLSFVEAWLTSLSFTMQLYFDFSGYTDMAIGAALIFNIRIPTNFNSPYKALDIQEFWRRWHMTLSRFLRDYVYIPLGGNRRGESKTLINIMLTFLICGLWHGAAWTFVFWGFFHGIGLVIHRLWMKTGLRLNNVIAWVLTFNYINIGWVFFRAKSGEDALIVLRGMAGFNGVLVSPNLASNPILQKLTVIGIKFGEWRQNLPSTENLFYFLCLLLVPFVLATRNSTELIEDFTPNWKNALATALMAACGLILLNQARSFLYFNF